MRGIVLASTMFFCCLAVTLSAQVPEHSFSLARFGDTPNHRYPYRIEVTKDSSFEALSYALVYRVDQGSELRVEGNPDSLADGSAGLEIPSQPTGSLVQYYLEFRDKYGITQILPDSAPQVKYSFRITQPPAGPEYLLLSLSMNETKLYDLYEHRVVGQIHGLSWRKAAWSPDGSIAVLYDYTGEDYRLHVLDITNFRLLRTVIPGMRINDYSHPLIEAGNRWAFFQGMTATLGKWRLYRLDLQSGEISPVQGLPENAYLTDEPHLLPGENKLLVCAGLNGNQSVLYQLDPASGALTTVAFLPGGAGRAFQSDRQRRRVFLFEGRDMRTLQGEPYVNLLERRYSWPMQTAYGVWQMGIHFETTEYVPQKGIMVFPNAIFVNYTDMDELVYWDTRDLLEPLQEIKISEMYPFKGGHPPFWPGISVSNDNSRLWISAHRLSPDSTDSPGLLQFDFDSRSFVEPIRLTGLAPGERPGRISAWRPTAAFSSPLTGDLDDNNRIDIFDMLSLLREMRTPSGSVPEERLDINRDGAWDVLDLLHLLRLLGR